MARSANNSPYQDYINKAEDFADQILRHSKHVLPHLARFCLVSTFFEDGVRMWFQWGEQRDYFSQTWNCSTVFGVLFVLFNLFGQLGGVAMVLARQKVEIAVAILGTVVVVQDEFDQLDKIYTEEKKQLNELEERFRTMEKEYRDIMEERRIAREKAEEANRELQAMIKAATLIQSFWRAFKARKQLKNKNKKGKKGKKGAKKKLR